MILLWGSGDDGPLAGVSAALGELGVETTFLDQRRLTGFHAHLEIGVQVSGRLTVGGRPLDLEALGAAYIRPLDWRHPRDSRPARRWRPPNADGQSAQDRLWTWADLTDVPVVNRPRAMGACFSKPYQLRAIVASGLEVPDTLLTTDPVAAEEFWGRHGTIVYKSISSTRSIVSRVTSGHRERLRDLRWCPVQFQEFVPGIDYRVHVVGEAAHCSAVRSDADDYRYAAGRGGAVRVVPARLPDEPLRSCRRLAEDMGLPVAGIDLRQTPEGRWYCFEINPSPAFSFYDREPGKPIALAVAALLRDLADSRS